MVSDTSQELTEPEMWFIRQAHRICPVGVLAATKTDLYPHWRDIVGTNTAHLQRAGVPMPILPVSSLLRSHAVTQNDAELNEESNFPAIVKFLSEKVLSRETDRVRDQVLRDIRSAAEQLTMSAGSELAVVNDPGLRDRLAEDMERRKRDALDALEQTALWQQVLNDGFTDLSTDVDHDMRARFRSLTEDIERQIDSCDPTQHWAEIGSRRRGSGRDRRRGQLRVGLPTRRGTGRRRGAFLRRGGAGFGADPGAEPRAMGEDFGRLKSLSELESKPAGKGQKVVTGLRGSYGGVVMIGMLSSVAGLGLFNPLSVGAGLILGRMAYKEDKENRLLRARAEAKTNVRRFVDDISFVVGKESRDRLKIIHRTLRDHYRDIANEISRSLNESLQSTIAAAHVEEAERDNKVRELERQLNILNQVTENVDKLRPQVTVGQV